MDGDTTRARIRALVNDGAATLQQVADSLGIRPQTVARHISRMRDAGGVRAQMAANKQPRLVEAHGEAKTLTEWAQDQRSQISVNTLRARIAEGWSLEDALATAPRRRGQATMLNAAEVAALRAAADLVRSLPRVHRNTPADAPEHAATRELRELIRQAAGRASIAEIARAAGLSHQQTLYHRDRA
jgi:DNA-binding transcriptional ArsR family regulator